MADQPDIQDTIDNLLSASADEDQAAINQLARLLYGSMGYHVPRGYDFENASHPQERLMWDQASLCLAFAREHFNV